jgi:hypothetical protein
MVENMGLDAERYSNCKLINEMRLAVYKELQVI